MDKDWLFYSRFSALTWASRQPSLGGYKPHLLLLEYKSELSLCVMKSLLVLYLMYFQNDSGRSILNKGMGGLIISQHCDWGSVSSWSLKSLVTIGLVLWPNFLTVLQRKEDNFLVKISDWTYMEWQDLNSCSFGLDFCLCKIYFTCLSDIKSGMALIFSITYERGRFTAFCGFLKYLSEYSRHNKHVT